MEWSEYGIIRNFAILFLMSGAVIADAPIFGPGTVLFAGGDTLQVMWGSSPAVADWNGDGRKDLLVGERHYETGIGYTGRIKLFINSGTNENPAFTYGTWMQADGQMIQLSTSIEIGVSNPQIVDWNGDGLDDLIVGDGYEGNIYHFRRLPSGDLTEMPLVECSGQPIDVFMESAPCINDWNEDGLPDLLTGQWTWFLSSDNDSIRVYLNSGIPGEPLFLEYSYVDEVHELLSVHKTAPQVADLNGDGLKDLTVSDQSSYIYFFENIGSNANPAFSSPVQLQSDGIPIQLWAAGRHCIDDWNEDGYPDLLHGDLDGNIYVYLALNTGVEGSVSTGSFITDVTPNPCDKNSSVQVQSPLIHSCEIRVFGLDGRAVIEDSAVQSDGNFSFILNTSDLPQGIYLIETRSGSFQSISSMAVIH